VHCYEASALLLQLTPDRNASAFRSTPSASPHRDWHQLPSGCNLRTARWANPMDPLIMLVGLGYGPMVCFVHRPRKGPSLFTPL